MTQYVKVRLYSRANNSFQANAVIVKMVSETSDEICHWHLLYKSGTLVTPPHVGNENRTHQFGDLVFSIANGQLCKRLVFTGSSIDSFETLLVSERLRTDSLFGNYRVILGDEVFGSNGGVFTVDFEDLFAREIREEAISSGILIKSAYTQDEIYSGFSGYHHNQRVHTFNRPIENAANYRIGVELEVYANSRDAYNKITTARTNWFQCEGDGSLRDADFPIEIKTIPLRPCDATSTDFWAEPLGKLAALAKSKQYNSTGLHVHISKEIFGRNEVERQKNLSKLCTFYTYYVEDDPDAHRKNVTICGRERGYAGSLEGAKTKLSEFAKKIGLDVVARSDEGAFFEVADEVKTAIGGQRWDINTRHWNDYGTVEFRKAKGAISKTRMAAICTWWEQMILYCNQTHPREFSFDDFFNKVCHDFPHVAYFFQREEEV